MLVIGTGDALYGVAGTGTAITVTATGIDVTTSTGAESLGKLYQGQLPTSAAALFTVPSGHSYVIKTLSVTNSTGSSVSGIQLFLSGSAAANSLIGAITLAAHYTATFSDNGWVVTDASGSIVTSGGSGGSGITQLTSDVVAGPGSGSQVATIQPGVVTLAKIQNASASSKLLGSGASGSGASYTELTLGTNLSMSGTTLNAAAGTTGVSGVLEAHTFSGASNTAFTSWYNSLYDEYIIELVNIVPSSAAGVLQLTVSSNGGSSYDTNSSYNYSQQVWSAAGQAQGGGGGTSQTSMLLFPFSGRTLQNSANQSISGQIRMYNPASTSLYVPFMGDMLGPDSANTNANPQKLVLAGYYIGLLGINAFKIAITAGTMSGTVRIYGVTH